MLGFKTACNLNIFLISVDSYHVCMCQFVLFGAWDELGQQACFGGTICLLVSFKILFYLDAQIWQWHELQLSASGKRGTRQMKLLQLSPLGEPSTPFKHKPKKYV